MRFRMILIALLVFVCTAYAGNIKATTQSGNVEFILEPDPANPLLPQARHLVPTTWYEVSVSGRRGNIVYEKIQSDNGTVILASEFGLVAEGGSEMVMPLMWPYSATSLNDHNNEATQRPAQHTCRDTSAIYNTDGQRSLPLLCFLSRTLEAGNGTHA